MATLVSVVDSVRNLLNEPLDTSRSFPDNTSGFWTDGILTDYANIAAQEVQNALVQTFEDYYITQTDITWIQGTIEYTLNSQVMKVRRVELDTGNGSPQEIVPVTINNRFSTGYSYNGLRSSVSDLVYYIRGNQIVFPNQSGAVTFSSINIFYVDRLSDIASGTSTFNIPDEFSAGIIWGTVRLALHQQQTQNTDKADAEWFRQLEMIKRQGERRQIQRPRGIKQVTGRGYNGF